MHVLLINGSPRREGNTHLALSEISHTLSPYGITSEVAWIGNRPVRGCIACGACAAKSLSRCAFDDDVCNAMIDRLARADALVVGSPTYYGTPTGSVLSLVHRMFYSAGAVAAGKPAAAVVVCRRGGATAAFQTLSMPFMMMNMPVVTSQYWNIVYGCDAGEASLDAEGLQTMRTLAHNMAHMLRSLHGESAEPPTREPHVFTNFIR